jgi:hypothetical protein
MRSMGISIWSEWRESNPRPLGPEPSTLPSALHPEVTILLYSTITVVSSGIQIQTRLNRCIVLVFKKVPEKYAKQYRPYLNTSLLLRALSAIIKINYSSSKKECECDIIEKKQVDDKNGANGNTENYNCRPQGWNDDKRD